MSPAIAPPAILRIRDRGTDKEWARLRSLICETCGGIPPLGHTATDPTVKAVQLARFGLRADGHTLLEP